MVCDGLRLTCTLALRVRNYETILIHIVKITLVRPFELNSINPRANIIKFIGGHGVVTCVFKFSNSQKILVHSTDALLMLLALLLYHRSTTTSQHYPWCHCGQNRVAGSKRSRTTLW